MEQFNWAHEKVIALNKIIENEDRQLQEMINQLQPVEADLDQYENRAQRREREKQERRNRNKSLAKL